MLIYLRKKETTWLSLSKTPKK